MFRAEALVKWIRVNPKSRKRCGGCGDHCLRLLVVQYVVLWGGEIIPSKEFPATSSLAVKFVLYACLFFRCTKSVSQVDSGSWGQCRVQHEGILWGEIQCNPRKMRRLTTQDRKCVCYVRWRRFQCPVRTGTPGDS